VSRRRPHGHTGWMRGNKHCDWVRNDVSDRGGGCSGGSKDFGGRDRGRLARRPHRLLPSPQPRPWGIGPSRPLKALPPASRQLRLQCTQPRTTWRASLTSWRGMKWFWTDLPAIHSSETLRLASETPMIFSGTSRLASVIS